MPFQKGHKLAPGGPRPNSGRPKDNCKELFQKMLRDSGAHKHFQAILANPTDKEIWLKAYKIALDRGWGLPAQSVEMTGEIGNIMLVRCTSETNA